MVNYIKKKLFASSTSSSSSSASLTYTYKGTITAAQMSTIGATPITLVAAPGANKFINVVPGSLSFRKSGGTTNGYTFNVSSAGFGLKHGASYSDYYNMHDLTGTAPASTANRILNGVSVTRCQFWTGSINYIVPAANTAVTITTDDGANPTAGDNDIIVSFTYNIIDVS